MGALRVGHDWMTSLSLFPFMHWRRKWQPTPVFLPGESQGWESLVGCHLWVAQSQTQLKWLSNSSSRITNCCRSCSMWAPLLGGMWGHHCFLQSPGTVVFNQREFTASPRQRKRALPSLLSFLPPPAPEKPVQSRSSGDRPPSIPGGIYPAWR